MPSNWLTVDSNFPSFTGRESPKEQVMKLSDYLFQLTDNLKYTLQNLGKDNWNAVALEQLSEDATKKLAEQIQNTMTQVQRLQNTVDQISGLTGRMGDAEENITYLQKDMEDHGDRIKSLEENMAFLEEVPQDHESRIEQLEELNGGAAVDIDELQQSVSNISDIVKSEENKATFGGEGKEVHLVGTIYINGKPYGGDETV